MKSLDEFYRRAEQERQERLNRQRLEEQRRFEEIERQRQFMIKDQLLYERLHSVTVSTSNAAGGSVSLSVPTNLAITEDGSILSWDSNYSNFEVWVSIDSAPYYLSGTTTLKTYNLNQLAEGDIFNYKVRAYQGTKYSQFTSSVNFYWSSYWMTRFPSELIVDVVSDSQIDLSWINNGIPTFSGIVIERSLNSYTWSEMTTVSSSESTYSDTGVTAYTIIYYYRVRYVRGSSHSASTRITSMFWNEMVVDGSFTTGGTDWRGLSVNNWSITGGEAIFSAASALSKTLYRPNIPVIAGRIYRIAFEVTSGTTLRFKIGTSVGDSVFAGTLSDYAYYSVGIYSFDAVCITSSDNLGITGDNTKGSFRLTSFSVKDKTYPTPYTTLSNHTSCCILGNVLYGINGQYLEKSLDFGDSWIRINHEFIGSIQSCFVSKDGILFVNCGTMGVGGTEIWRSIDDGENWAKVMNTNYGLVRIPWDFTQSPSGTIFIGEYTQSYNSAYLWKSINDGENWTRVDEFFSGYSHIHQVFIDPETQRLYVAVGDTNKDTYYSDDEGTTWHQIFVDAGFQTGFVSITSVPGTRYFGPDLSDSALYKSTDDITLISIYKPPEKYDVYWLEVGTLEDSSTLYTMVYNSVSTSYSSLLAKSIDSGDTWNIIMTQENSMANFSLNTSDYRHKIPKEFGYLITKTQEKGLIRIDKQVEIWSCLNKPTCLTLTLIQGGVRLDWVDNTEGRLETEIWAQTDEGVWTLINIVDAGIITYSHICNTVAYPYYKLRTKVRFNYSEYSDIETTPISYFTTTWNTENAGSATKTIVIPTNSVGYDCYVDWGEGGTLEHIVGTSPSITHVFATTGIKTVKIAGAFPRIYFNATGDCLKLLTIESWGGTVWSNMANAFKGCTNLIGNYTDSPDTSQVADFSGFLSSCVNFNSPLSIDTSNALSMSSMIYGCTLFNQPVNFNTSKVTNMSSMFYNCDNFNQSVSSFNTSLVTTMASMFYGCHAFNQLVPFSTVKVNTMSNMFRYCNVFNQSLAAFDIHLVTTMADMLNGSNTLSTANYDAMLISWAIQDVKNSVSFHAGDATYSQTLVDSGTTDGTTTNKLVDSDQNFITTVTIGDVVRNTTDGTYAIVTNIDDNATLSLSVDIIVSGETYTIQHSDAAKSRAHLVISHTWTITDGGPV
jgi:surface protein